MEAATKYNRIVQHGVQLRSSVAIQEAIKHLRDGLIGNVYMARALIYKWRPDIGNQGPSAVPAGLNWDLWQGPAQAREFSKTTCITTGTGFGNTATATSATREFTKPISLCGDWT